MATPRTRRPRDLRAGTFQAAINSFTLHLHAEGKSPKTVRTYIEAAQWFAGQHLRNHTDHHDWEDVTPDDIRTWTVWLLQHYSDSYANNQYRALQAFFKWWSNDEELPDPTAKLRPPAVGEKIVPVFTDAELTRPGMTAQPRTATSSRGLFRHSAAKKSSSIFLMVTV